MEVMKKLAAIGASIVDTATGKADITDYELIVGRAPAPAFNPKTGKTTRYLVRGRYFPKHA